MRFNRRLLIYTALDEPRFQRATFWGPAPKATLSLRPGEDRARLAVVDDNTNDIIVFKLRRPDD